MLALMCTMLSEDIAAASCASVTIKIASVQRFRRVPTHIFDTIVNIIRGSLFNINLIEIST